MLPDAWALQTATASAAKFASARQVVAYSDSAERPYMAVAAGDAGLYILSPPQPLEVEENRISNCGYGVDGDTIGCEDRTLGEVAGVVGTPFTLHYSSRRMPGGNALLIPVSGEKLSADVTALEVTVRVAGREFSKRFEAETNLRKLFVWDGRDEQNRIPLGAQWATVEVKEIHANGVWNVNVWAGTIGAWDTRAHGLGGWSFDVHHFFDPIDRILYLGSGAMRQGQELGVVEEKGVVVRIASEGGVAVYEFDRESGRHLRTVNALTKTDMYTFTYL